MGMEQKTHFMADKLKCISCGKCVNVCFGMVLFFSEEGCPRIRNFERFGWRGRWRCQHCLAVCLTGAISIFDKKPENSLPLPPSEKSIAFCCISTGEIHFPNDKAAEIAIQTVKEYKRQTKSEIEVKFNVFKDLDYGIYKKLLRTN